MCADIKWGNGNSCDASTEGFKFAAIGNENYRKSEFSNLITWVTDSSTLTASRIELEDSTILLNTSQREIVIKLNEKRNYFVEFSEQRVVGFAPGMKNFESMGKLADIYCFYFGSTH